MPQPKKSRLLLVSNRLPITLEFKGQDFTLQPSSGGLATGLKGPHEKSDGTWIGWPGETPRLGEKPQADLSRDLAKLALDPVYLTRNQVKGFYEDFSNGAIWPVFHDLIEQLPLVIEGWQVYRTVNQKFAEIVAASYHKGDIIWVHDYQLMLVPKLLRDLIPDARIGFFLHIPFPAPEIFSVLPGRNEMLEGMLAADLVGFHTEAYAGNFRDTCESILAVTMTDGHIEHEGRDVKVGAFPMGIDWRNWQEHARATQKSGRLTELRADLGDRTMLLGIDRLDYTKGLPRRIAAVERLLDRDPSLAERVRFVQIIVPSRENVESYSRLLRQLTELVGRINSTFGSASSVPIHLVHRSLPEDEVSALYSTAHVMLVTPVRDGMNLVAKEFIASRLNGDGVLVLSEFAGAAEELSEAVMVNPYDVEGLANQIEAAIHMPRPEQKRRMAKLREKVRANDVHRWADNFLSALGD